MICNVLYRKSSLNIIRGKRENAPFQLYRKCSKLANYFAANPRATRKFFLLRVDALFIKVRNNVRVEASAEERLQFRSRR